jgi:hypothetical protein
MALLKGSVAQSVLFQKTWRETLDQDIALLYQVPQDICPGGAGDVQCDALFAGVQVQKRRTVLGVGGSLGKRAGASRHVPGAGWLDFDDVCSQASQEFGTEGASGILAEIQNANIA